MSFSIPVNQDTFDAIQNVDIDKLSHLNDCTLRPILPCLVRMSLCAPLDTSEKWTVDRKKILKCLSGIDVVNSLVALLSIDFHELEQDARKEQQLRAKVGGQQTESVLIAQLEQGLALEFERSDAARKLRLLLSELLFIMSQVQEPSRGEFYHKQSELFESEVYMEEVSDVLCIAQAELPSLLPVMEVAEALLHVHNGPLLICRVVANVPDSFPEACRSLISSGEKQDEESIGGLKRAEALRMLCEMCPSQTLNIRAMCVEYCRMPSLAVALTLHHCHESSQGDDDMQGTGQSEEGLSDVVGFVSGLLLGSDVDVRNWFSQFIRTGQKRKDESSMLPPLRQELLEQLIAVLPDRIGEVSDRQVVQGCAFMRLYCALKCIAGLRFNDEEIRVLLRLVTCHPRPSAAGVRFVCLGLCMVLACPSLLSAHEQERMCIEWIQWLIKESGHFEKVIGVQSSFGEMLLLIAIHFHGSQNNAIADLVSATLGMKSAVKANALSRMKSIFTQDIFTEQVVASHAVKVSVTKQLSAKITGYLPVHCIYQLLKSRAFSKHKVSIKDWIFRQLCECTTPIHPLIPLLIDVFVSSIIVPSSKTDRMNEPIREGEILLVFRNSELTQHLVGQSVDSKLDTSASGLEAMQTDDSVQNEKSDFTAQLLLVYYVLLYHDTRLNNMKTIVTSQRKVPPYSQQLMAQLPMKALLQGAQKEQQLYAGLFSPMLKLMSTHFPDLCLVEDWLDEALQDSIPATAVLQVSRQPCSQEHLQKAFVGLPQNQSQLIILLDQLACMSPNSLLPFTDIILGSFQALLDPVLSRRVLEAVKRIWIKLNTIIPRKLRVLTVNALRQKQRSAFMATEYTEKDLTMDPLLALQCDDHVFRCPPVLEIVLRVLEAFLQMSKSSLSEHIQANPVVDKGGHVQSTQEQEELKSALMATQDSAAVQILLECCLPKSSEEDGCVLSNLREVQCLICCRLHQMFISDPNLAKLVHFQGYPSELLPVTVAGVPSMHICLDFIPELLSQPHIEKQVFAIELVSHLSVQYSLPKSLGVAKLAVNIMTTLLGVLPSETRSDFFLPTLPAVGRIARAFPPLSDDIVAFLVQLGQVCSSHIASINNGMGWADVSDIEPLFNKQLSLATGCDNCNLSDKALTSQAKYARLYQCIKDTFSQIVTSTAMLKHQVSM